ncbi:hypothetical protein [Actinoallomurus acaciae]|uniref:Uncharacterized protein n=1 Tax=Actinoallomurus acaciae TaxID=502577 RepID=A0ABV5YCJ3_9ACTN
MFLISRQFAEPSPYSVGDRPETFPAPSTDPAYDFTVTAFYQRTVKGGRRATVWLQREDLARTSEVVRDMARSVSSEYSILKPVEAEKAINDVLVRSLAGEGRSARSIWRARVEVTPPDEVREMLQATLKEQYEIEARARVQELLVATTDQLRELWSGFLSRTAKHSSAPHALELAQDPQHVADVLKKMLDEHRDDARHLLELVSGIVEAHRSAGILDLVVETDSVLRRTLAMMGIELPEQEPDPFVVTERDEPPRTRGRSQDGSR